MVLTSSFRETGYDRKFILTAVRGPGRYRQDSFELASPLAFYGGIIPGRNKGRALPVIDFDLQRPGTTSCGIQKDVGRIPGSQPGIFLIAYNLKLEFLSMNSAQAEEERKGD